jgi:hypothetical protein
MQSTIGDLAGDAISASPDNDETELLRIELRSYTPVELPDFCADSSTIEYSAGTGKSDGSGSAKYDVDQFSDALAGSWVRSFRQAGDF